MAELFEDKNFNKEEKDYETKAARVKTGTER